MRVLTGGALVALVVIAAGFVAERILGPGADPMSEAREAVEGLSYPVSTREASEGEGDEPEDIPPGLIHLDKNLGRGGGFTVWDDWEETHRGESRAEWIERGQIAVAIEESLCRKETGKACKV